MISKAPREATPPPVLVLGLGNLLLGDDAVGLALLERLRSRWGDAPGVEFLDGGTQGIALMPRLEGRRALLVLDAVALGEPPGTIHVLDDPSQAGGGPVATAHGANAGSLLAAAELCDARPGVVTLIGVEPREISTRIGLSEPVESALSRAVEHAHKCLTALV